MSETKVQTQRKRISGNPQDMIFEMSEGNPGALRVLMEMLQGDQMGGFMSILGLDDMNIRGSQIWVAYKDHCKSEIATLREAINGRDPALVATVNREHPHGEQAVTSGASYAHR